MKDTVLKVEITPVSIDGKSPTRFDIYVKGVNGSACGYCNTLSQAESWAAGIQLALKEQHKISSRGLNK